MRSRRSFVQTAALGIGGIVLGRPSMQAHSAVPNAAESDDTLIVFQGSNPAANGSNSLYMMTRSGSDLVQLIPDFPGPHMHPDWSPDGRTILFTSEASGELLMFDLETQVPELLIAPEGLGVFYDYGAFSPDGTRVAFTRYEAEGVVEGPPHASVIQVLELETRKITEVVRSEQPRLVDVARWSGDGKYLVVGVDLFDEEFYEAGSAIATVPASGGELTYLTEMDHYAYYPDWNPVDDVIVFSIETVSYAKSPATLAEKWDLFTIRPDGSDLKQITDLPIGEELWQPSWTPDGKTIIATHGYSEYRETVLVDPNTASFERVGHGEHVQTHARMQP